MKILKKDNLQSYANPKSIGLCAWLLSYTRLVFLRELAAFANEFTMHMHCNIIVTCFSLFYRVQIDYKEKCCLKARNIAYQVFCISGDANTLLADFLTGETRFPMSKDMIHYLT